MRLIYSRLTFREAHLLMLERNLSLLESSLVLKDGEFDFITTLLLEKKDAYNRLDRELADMIHNYDKLLDKFNAHQEATNASKSEAVVDAYWIAREKLLPITPLKMEIWSYFAKRCLILKMSRSLQWMGSRRLMRWWPRSWQPRWIRLRTA